MTGVDQTAVHEIEQLIRLQSSKNLNDTSTLHKGKGREVSSPNLASGGFNQDQNTVLLESAGQETKKSKVIFSVKKEQLNNHSFYTKAADGSSYQFNKSKAKKKSNENAYSSVDTGN